MVQFGGEKVTVVVRPGVIRCTPEQLAKYTPACCVGVWRLLVCHRPNLNTRD